MASFEVVMLIMEEEEVVVVEMAMVVVVMVMEMSCKESHDGEFAQGLRYLSTYLIIIYLLLNTDVACRMVHASLLLPSIPA